MFLLPISVSWFLRLREIHDLSNFRRHSVTLTEAWRTPRGVMGY